MNREFALGPAKKTALSHNPTLPSIHDFLADGKSDSQLWQGAIHKLDPSIHNLIHAFWQAKGAQKAISAAEIAILTVRLLLSHLTSTISGSLTITRRYKEVYQ
jgi:hypothetical protein